MFGGPFGCITCDGQQKCVSDRIFINISPEVFRCVLSLSAPSIVLARERPRQAKACDADNRITTSYGVSLQFTYSKDVLTCQECSTGESTCVRCDLQFG